MNKRICRSCGSHKLLMIVDLGETPLANRLLRPDEIGQSEDTYPLELVFCQDCYLVQITESVSPQKLFSNYVYFSSYSDTMLRHAEQLAAQVIDSQKLDKTSLVLEIASNDGYLLQNYQKAGIQVLGIEPAENIAEVANKKGISTRAEFFSDLLAEKLASESQYADVIHANNVMAHIPQINGVITGFKQILKPDGVVISESPYVKDLIDHVEFDTIYHEHLFYYSLSSQAHLFERHGLKIFDVERLSIHGGSLRIFAGHVEHVQETNRFKSLIDEERAWGVGSYSFYESFGERIKQFKSELRSLLTQLKREGASIAAYGASAKGSTLLNYCQIGAETLDFVVDRSEVKQGLFTPGTQLPILAPSALLEKRPDYVLLLVWNFAEEILQQQDVYRQMGGKFIIPLPEVTLI